jgi:hypothetical protein
MNVCERESFCVYVPSAIYPESVLFSDLAFHARAACRLALVRPCLAGDRDRLAH